MPSVCVFLGRKFLGWSNIRHMIEESVIKTVIERTDIVQLISGYVQLKRRGGRYWGLCPFHREKTPSFSVNADRGVFYCFSCKTGGGAIDFLMKLEGITYPEAIERLAERLGIPVTYTTRGKADNSEARKARERERSYYSVMEAAQKHFVAMLAAPCGANCLGYAHRRGITDEMIQSFGLGYSPDSWDSLVKSLEHEHLSLNDAKEVGLLGARDSGGYYARFRNRLMFPVHNVRGEIIAFGGRVLENAETAKYINSPETAIYKKGDNLYGLYQARMHITREHCAILVEGNVDVVMMHAFGFCHTVASMGTALTPKQAQLLYRHTRRVYLMYDGDAAGKKAMIRALPILLGCPFEGLYAVELPGDDDPDSFLRVYGAEGMRSLIENAKSLGQWCVEQKCQEILKMPPELRKSGFGELGELLHGFPDTLTQRHYLEEASRHLNVDASRLATEVGMVLTQMPAEVPVKPAPLREESGPHANSMEWTVAYMVLCSNEKFDSFMAQQYMDLIQEPALRALLEEYSALPSRANAHEVLESLSENSRQLYERIICTELDVAEEDIEKWYKGALAGLIATWASRERQQIAFQLAEAVKQNDTATVSELLQYDKQLVDAMRQTQEDRKKDWQTAI